MTASEPRNPFYLLLLIACLVFTINALAVAVVPVLIEKAEQAGADVPREGWHQRIKNDGVWWLLYELAAIVVLSLLSMGLDRLRSLKKERAEATIPPTREDPSTR
jgi:hypothetical protein